MRRSVLAANGLYLGVAWGKTPSQPATLHLKVTDAATGELLPCSIALTTTNGTLLTQHAGYRSGFRSPGEFRSDLPAGRVKVVVTRGFDYVAQERVLDLEPGKLMNCAISLSRVSTLHKEGWVCGDNHVHMKHGESVIDADFAFVGLSARAEALDYMSVAQQWNVDNATPASLTQALAEVATPDCTLVWNMEAPKNYWGGDVSHCMGHGWTLGVSNSGPSATDPIKELFAMSAGDYQKEKVPTPNFESHSYIHAAGGFVSYTHPCRIWRGDWGGKNGFPLQKEKFVSNMAQELPFDTVAGPTYDSIDIMMQTGEHLVNELGQQLWFMLLNHGYRIPATASTDATFDNPGRAVPGAVRVYTHIEGPVNVSKVAEAMKLGRNFVTSGPLLDFTIGPNRLGDAVPASAAKTHQARIKAWSSGKPSECLTRIDVIRNGEVYKSFPITNAQTQQELTLDIREATNAWYIVRCLGSAPDQIAISNPIYFEKPGYRTPAPAIATVNLTIARSGSDDLLDATYEVIQMIGRLPKTISTGVVNAGKARIIAPATSRIRVSAAGYVSQTKSIFIDTPELIKLTTEMQLDELLDWKTYEKIRKTLSAISLEYVMQPGT